MRLRNIPRAAGEIEKSDWVVHEPEEKKENWKSIFPKQQEIHIEIGMGKGNFIIEMAKEHPDINYIGIEKYDSVLLRALEKLEGEEVMENLRFLCIQAEDINAIFAPEEIDRIYLNFSDPWPKKRYAKRRLTSRQFLDRYDKILKKTGTIEFKTDNQDLFSFSLEELEPAGWKLVEETRDLHHNEKMNAGNIMTEYEEKFSKLGNSICKCIICR